MPETILATQDLSKRFGKRMVVDHLNLEVHEGEIFGFLGPNGSGKTTTPRMLLSLINPTHGDSFLFGHSVKNQRTRYLSQVGALVEKADFYGNLSALTNLKMLGRMHGNVSEERCRDVLAMVNLADRAEDKVKTYSHGMKQRLGIAQAILHRPQLLILDEPSTGLDPQGMHEVRQMIRSFAADDGMTVFLSSHLLNEVEQICTSMAVLSEGKLLVSGAVDSFLTAESATLTELQAAPREKALTILRSLDLATEVSEQGEWIRCRIKHEHRPAVVQALTDQGVEIYALTPVSRLEDYFLSLFGFSEIP